MPLYICIAIMAALTLQSVFTGVLQGMGRYQMLSYVLAVQNGIRLVAVMAAVSLLHWSYNGALGGVLVSYLLIVAYYVVFLRDRISLHIDRSRLQEDRFRRFLRGAIPLSLMWTYLGIVSNIDIPLVKHFFPETETGQYSAGAILGRIAWFLPSILVYVLFPEVVRSDAEGKSSIRNVLIIAVLTLAISFGVAGIFSLFPETVLTLLLGAKYAGARHILIVISFSMAVLAMLAVFYNFCLAKRLTFFLLPAYVILVVCVVAILYYFHQRPIDIALVLLAGLVLTSAINITQFFYRFRNDLPDWMRRRVS
jgi:O-antigen/teichoic acid export membrane protein